MHLLVVGGMKHKRFMISLSLSLLVMMHSLLKVNSAAAIWIPGEGEVDTRVMVGARGIEDNRVVNTLYIAIHKCSHGW